MLDIHCHILPGVDDGSESVMMTGNMLQEASDLGISSIIASPHIGRGQTDPRSVMHPYSKVCKLAKQYKIQIYEGYEVNYLAIMNMSFSDIGIFCIKDTKCILIELPTGSLFPTWEYVLSRLTKEYTPIIVHPERFKYIQKDPALITEMRSFGCEIQIDAKGLFGNILSSERRISRLLLKNGLVDYIASDAHEPADYHMFAKAKSLIKNDWPQGGQLNYLLQY